MLFTYQTSPHESTGATPFKVLYGREAALPTEELLCPPQERDEVYVDTYIEEMTTRMSEAWSLARNQIKSAQSRQKKKYDRRARVPDFDVGDRVLLYKPAKRTGELRKLAMPNEGYYRISDMTDKNVFITPEGKPKTKPKCVAWERIHRCPEGLSQPSETESTVEEGETDEREPEGSWRGRLRSRGGRVTTGRSHV